MRAWIRSGFFGLLAFALGGCGGSTAHVAGSEAACAFLVDYEGRIYAGWGVQVAPREVRPVGTGVLLGCDDGNGASRDEKIELAEIDGVSPAVALAWRGHGDTVLIRDGIDYDRLPPALSRLQQAPRCAPRDEPIQLSGPWLGITGLDGRREREVVPPYHLEIYVEESSAKRYERAFLSVRVPARLGRPLTRADIRSSLWEGGTIEVGVGCANGRYVAKRVEAKPPS